MVTFTLDTDNHIVAHAGIPSASDKHEVFASQVEFLKAASPWPSSRFVEIWNSFAGAAPFEDLRPVKKFTSRDTAVARIWEAIARLEPMVAPAKQSAVRSKGKRANASRTEAPAKKEPRVSATAQLKSKHASAQPAPANKKAQVIAMLRHAKGVSLTGIMEATGWQKHTVRGFISILGRKAGLKIESAKNAAGHRVYRMAR